MNIRRDSKSELTISGCFNENALANCYGYVPEKVSPVILRAGSSTKIRLSKNLFTLAAKHFGPYSNLDILELRVNGL